jgi:quinol monooxygenase YgiN
MIQEVVEIRIDPAKADAFASAMALARPIFLAAPGCESFTLMQSVEHEGAYRLAVEWATIADHMEGFRNSDDFSKWRALVTPFLAESLSMQHFDTVAL